MKMSDIPQGTKVMCKNNFGEIAEGVIEDCLDTMYFIRFLDDTTNFIYRVEPIAVIKEINVA